MRLIEVEVLGVKLQAGLLNPKVARKYDEGLGKVLRTVEDAQSCSDGAKGIEMMCGAVVDFVDEVCSIRGSLKIAYYPLHWETSVSHSMATSRVLL